MKPVDIHVFEVDDGATITLLGLDPYGKAVFCEEGVAAADRLAAIDQVELRLRVAMVVDGDVRVITVPNPAENTHVLALYQKWKDGDNAEPIHVDSFVEVPQTKQQSSTNLCDNCSAQWVCSVRKSILNVAELSEDAEIEVSYCPTHATL